MLNPGASLGRYVVKRKLAEGGMAEVYLAQATGPEGFAKDVVIKVVRDFLANEKQFVDMFIAEARLSSRLNHANIVQIFDFGKIDQSYYLAMEYVRGASLWDVQRRCKQHGVPFPPTIAAEIGAHIARGLQYAHGLSDRGKALSIVHRDVTPHNVLISFEGAVKLTDFGIAKASTSQTAPGMLKGKFAYMAPEQARGEPVDARTDLFALGIVLWELLTGGRLFDADTDVGVLRAVQENAIAPPHRLNGDVAPALSEIVMKALARPVAERFQTAFEFERALSSFVLSHARSVEDSSPALFVQQLFREEYEAIELTNSNAANPLPSEGSSAHADTVMGDGRATELMTATPSNPPAPERGVMDDTAADRPKTAPMPGVTPSQRLKPVSGGKRPSAKFEVGGTEPMPAVVSKQPSRPLNEVASEVPTDRHQPAAARSNGVLVAALASALTLGVVLIVWQVSASSSPPEPSPSAAPMTPLKAEPAPPLAPLGGHDEPVAPPPPPSEAPPVAVTPPPSAEPPAVLEQLPAPSTPRKPIAAATGVLEVKAVPFATLFIDGKRWAEIEGSQRLKLAAGPHELVFKHPRSTQKMTISVKAGQAVPVSFDALAQ